MYMQHMPCKSTLKSRSSNRWFEIEEHFSNNGTIKTSYKYLMINSLTYKIMPRLFRECHPASANGRPIRVRQLRHYLPTSTNNLRMSSRACAIKRPNLFASVTLQVLLREMWKNIMSSPATMYDTP